jgi:hypothetical protein
LPRKDGCALDELLKASANSIGIVLKKFS